MQTRTARYAAYRKRRQSEELFIRSIQHLNEQAENYKQQINAINPNILMDAQSNKADVKLYPFTSKHEFDPKEFSKVKEFADKINTEKKNTNINQIGDFLAKQAKSSIIDNTGNISEDWKNNIENYQQLNKINEDVEKCQTNLVEFQTNSEKLLSRVNASVQETNNVSQIKDFAITKYVKTPENKKMKVVYLSILIALALFLVIAIILCILGAVL